MKDFACRGVKNKRRRAVKPMGYPSGNPEARERGVLFLIAETGSRRPIGADTAMSPEGCDYPPGVPEQELWKEPFRQNAGELI